MNKILAALTFFTRLPLWRLRNIPSEAYSRVVDLWPLAGWVTGGTAALVFVIAASFLPLLPSAILAIAARMILTGGLHEDGLADFFDGFGGGGHDRERILAIMKDSHIGAYGVMAIALYIILYVSLISQLPTLVPYYYDEEIKFTAFTIIAADAWGKTCSAFIINVLPYGRTAATAKNRLVYSRMTIPAAILCIILGLLPCALLIAYMPEALFVMAGTAAVAALMILFLRRRLGGYTGDCCGAISIICELTMLILISSILFTD